jgi:integrase
MDPLRGIHDTRLPDFTSIDPQRPPGIFERCLWRLPYETAVRADEALSLNVEDVDVGNKRAVIISRGGDRGLLYFQTGSARLLPRLLAGRWRGPLFLAERPPVPARVPAAENLSPQRPGRGALRCCHSGTEPARPSPGRAHLPRRGEGVALPADG